MYTTMKKQQKKELIQMNLEENEHILENKELKTNTQKRRFIAINNTSESSFTNGLVTIIHQEQFNQLKKEHQELLELNENPITKEDLQELENKIQLLQEEKNQLEKDNEKLSEEKEKLSDKLELALNNNTVKELKEEFNERKNEYKEQLNQKEEKIASYESKIDKIKEENEALKIALTKTLTEYEHLKNRSLIDRLINKDTVELSNYKKLANPVYNPEEAIETNRIK